MPLEDHSLLNRLTYREREILKLMYGIGDGYTYTLEEVGRIFKVTRERVRQVRDKALRKLAEMWLGEPNGRRLLMLLDEQRFLDQAAIAAMQGMCHAVEMDENCEVSWNGLDEGDCEVVAQTSYRLAEALAAERKKRMAERKD